MSNFIKKTIGAGIAIGLALLFYSRSTSLPLFAKRSPTILIVVVILLSILMIIEAYRKKHENPQEKPSKINVKRAVIFTLFIAIYIFSIKPIGYFVMTPIYIISTYLYLKSTSLRNMVLISLGFTVFVYALFVMFLKLPIPLGPIS